MDLYSGHSFIGISKPSYIFSFRPAFIAEKVGRCANHNGEKEDHSSQHREGSRIHPGSRQRSKVLRPDGRITQGVVRRRAPSRRRCPGSGTTENGQSNQERKKGNAEKSFHRGTVYTRRLPLRLETPWWQSFDCSWIEQWFACR